MKVGVYSIRSMSTGKVYIGSSINIIKRWCRHRTAFKSSKQSRILQEHYDQYGKEDLYYTVLELCTENELKIKEAYWINLLQTTHPEKGFNVHTEDSLKKSLGNKSLKIVKRKVLSSIMVVIINIETGNITKDLKNNLENQKAITKCLQYWYKPTKNCNRSYKGNIYVHEKYYDESFDYVNYKKPKAYVEKLEKIKKEIKPYSERNFNRIPVIACSKITGEEKIYASITECCLDLNLKYNKVLEVLRKEYRKYSHRNYYLTKIIS